MWREKKEIHVNLYGIICMTNSRENPNESCKIKMKNKILENL